MSEENTNDNGATNNPIYISDLAMLTDLYNDINLLVNTILSDENEFNGYDSYDSYSDYSDYDYNNDSNNSFDASFTNATLYDKPAYKKVFDVENHGHILNHCCYNSLVHKNSQCPIYMMDFENGDEVVALPCHHCFVPEAIYHWLEDESHVCPCCRYELPFIEVKNN